jgi:hypothetical protein
VVEHSPHHPKNKGLSPASAAGTGRENKGPKQQLMLDNIVNQSIDISKNRHLVNISHPTVPNSQLLLCPNCYFYV